MTRAARWILSFVLLIGTGYVSELYGQSSLNELVEDFNTYRIANYQEKVYVHTDRSFYVTGDYLWLKVRLHNASSHEPGALSKVVYIELVDGNNPVIQAKVPLLDGSGYAAIYLPASLNSSVYQLRGYTKWMQNFGADGYFHKPLAIVNPFKPLAPFEQRGQGPKVDLQFFPEGGTLVSGIESRIAFRLVDGRGMALHRDGVVVNQNSDTVATFRSFHGPLGVFSFVPQANNMYTAIVRDREGAPIRIELPKPKPEGYVIRLDDGKSLNLSVRSSTSSQSVVYVFVHTRNSIKLHQAVTLEGGIGKINIDRDLLDDGISHITVFNGLMKPVAERLYFKKPTEQKVSFEASYNASKYFKRRRVIMDIKANVGQGVAADMDISLSVYRIDSLQRNDPMDIMNYLLLTSDLRGTVDDPGFYFSDDPTARDAADLLMMTHGWRRFTWDSLKSAASNKKHIPEYRAQTVSGVVSHPDSGTTAVNVPVYLSIPGKNFHFRGSRTDRYGRFQFELPGYYGKSKAYVMPDLSRDSTVQITLDNPFSRSFLPMSIQPLDIPKEYADQLLRRSINMQMENAYHEEERIISQRVHYDSLPFFDVSDAHYNLDDYTRFSIMEDVMREYVPGVYVRKRKRDFYFRVFNKEKNDLFKSDPLVLMDGLPVFNTNKIIEYDPLKVKSLDVVTHRYLYGAVTFYGIVSYRTYDGDLRDFPVDERITVLDLTGLELQREFFSPVYELNSTDNRTPDFRDLLYWNPRLTTDSNGKAQVSFYTSDQSGTYAISIQGSMKDGSVGSALFTLTVEDENN